MPEQTIDRVPRREFRSFIEISNAVRLTDDDRRRMLRLSEQQWSAWAALLSDGPLPVDPPVPEMLLRLGIANHSLSKLASDVLLAA